MTITQLIPIGDLLAAFDRHSAEWLAGANVASILTISALVAVILAAAGYRHYFDDYTDKTHILRVDGDTVTGESLATFTDATAGPVAELARAAERNARGRAESRARATLAAVEGKPRPRGTNAYLRAVAVAARDQLPEATAEELEAMEAQRVAQRDARRAQRANEEAAPALDRRDYYKERREALAARRDNEARELIGKWADRLPAGRHPLPELWASFSAAITASRKLPGDHGARHIGKNRFYAALDAHGRVITGGQRKRFYDVAEEVTA